MKYKTSFFNKAIILEDFKRLWGLAALYFITLFLTGPLAIMMRMGDPNRDIRHTVEMFLGLRMGGVNALYSVGFAILLGILIYRYLHTINSTTVIHSFPITRKELFYSHNFAAALLIIVPVLVNTLFLLGIMFVSNDASELYQKIFTFQGIMTWTGKILLANITIYLVSTLVAMVTGTSIVQGVLSLIFIFLPLGLGSLILVNLDQLVYGFAAMNSNIEAFLMKIMPFPYILSGDEISTGQLLWYLTLGVILYILALTFYKRRNLERATDPITLDGLKPIFKYGVTFCTMSVGGLYFNSIISTDLWLYIGYFVGAIIGYIIAEMLLKKTIWVFRNMKGFVIYTLIIILAFVGIKMDFIGFEKRVPELDNIQNAYYGNLYDYEYFEKKGLEKPENIELVRQLHEEMIENKGKFKNVPEDAYYDSLGIIYELENGKKMLREYEVPHEFIKKNPTIKKIFESMEYKRDYYDIFKIDIQNTSYIEVDSGYTYEQSKNVKIIDPDEVDEFLQVIKMDLFDETFGEYNSNIIPWANIGVKAKDGANIFNKDEPGDFNPQLDIPWKKSYSKTTEWLKEKGYYEQVRVMPSDVKEVVVGKLDKNKMDQGYIHEELDQLLKGPQVKIKDENKIEYLLNHHEGNIYYPADLESSYYLGVYFNNGHKVHGSISEEKLPREIKEALNK